MTLVLHRDDPGSRHWRAHHGRGWQHSGEDQRSEPAPRGDRRCAARAAAGRGSTLPRCPLPTSAPTSAPTS